jgi:hypothetical protein
MLFGQLLGRHATLNAHDIEEILQEQQYAERRFGDAALLLGLATPEQVLSAWVDQLSAGPQRVDLLELGVDGQATHELPAAFVRERLALPVRSNDHVLIIATATPLDHGTVAEIERHTGKSVRQALVSPDDLARAIGRFTPVAA